MGRIRVAMNPSFRIFFAALGLIRAASGVSLAIAAPCDSPVDLRSGVLAGLPSGEQGETFACGYFASATALDAFRKSTGGPERGSFPIDAVALAIDLAADRHEGHWGPLEITSDPLSIREGHRGSRLCSIIGFARQRGVCDPLEPRVSDRGWMTKRSNEALSLYDVLNPYSEKREAARRAELAETVRKVSLAIGAFETAPSSESISRAVWEYRDSPYRAIRALLYPRCEDDSARRIFSDIRRCDERWFVGMSTLGIGSQKRHAAKVEASIHARLDDPAARPVTVLQCYQVLHEGRAYRRSHIWADACNLHYVNVIGRRKQNGVCQFLIRNSYDPAGGDSVSTDWARDGVDFWVDAEPLSRSIFAIYRLEN